MVVHERSLIIQGVYGKKVRFDPSCSPFHAAKQKSLQNKTALMSETETERLTERVIDPRGLVAYQPGSIVSRMLINTPAGTITVFAFDADEGLSEHTAPYDAVLEVLEGEALISIAGTDYSLTAGEMIIMPAGKPHAVQAVTQFKMMLTMIHA